MLLTPALFLFAFQDAPTPSPIALDPPRVSTTASNHEIAVQGSADLPAGTVIEIAVAPKSRGSSKTNVAVAKATVRAGKFRETIRIPNHFIPGAYVAAAAAKTEDQRGDIRKKFLKEFEEGTTLPAFAEFRIGELKEVEAAIVKESQEIVGQIRFIDVLVEKTKEESPNFGNINDTIRVLSEIFNRSAPGSPPTLFPASRAVLAPAAIRGIEIVKQDSGKKPRISNTVEPPAKQELPDISHQSRSTLAGEYLALIAEETGFVKSSLKKTFDQAVTDNNRDLWTNRLLDARKDRTMIASLLGRSHMAEALEIRKGVASDLATLSGETMDRLVKAWSAFVDGNRTDEAKEEVNKSEEIFNRQIEGILARLGQASTLK